MLRCAVVVLSFVTDTPCVYQISHEQSRLESVAKVAFADIGEIISKVVLMAFVFLGEKLKEWPAKDDIDGWFRLAAATARVKSRARVTAIGARSLGT